MQQPLRSPAQATTDARGNCTFTFPPVPQGQVWTGTVQILNAPNYSSFVATVAEIGWGTWQGSQPFGPIQAEGRLTVKVVGTTLLPNTAYTAMFQGIASTPEDAPLATPSVNTPQTTQVTPLFSGPISFANALTQVTIQPSGISPAHAGLIITWTNPSGGSQQALDVFAQGLDTNTVLASETIIQANSSLAIPLKGLDTTIQLTLSGLAGATYPYSGTLEVSVQQLSPLVIPQTRLAYIGTALATGNVLCAGAGATTQVLAGSIEFYYRIKLLAVLVGPAAPAAGTNWQFVLHSSGKTIVGWRSDGTITQECKVPCDFALAETDGIDLVNTAATTVNAEITYEQWPP